MIKFKNYDLKVWDKDNSKCNVRIRQDAGYHNIQWSLLNDKSIDYQIKTIEHLIRNYPHIELTESAIKQIGL